MLLDLKMPGLDGMEVLQRLRQRDPSVLVIVITGYATVETAIEAMKQGAYDFIPKPFEPDQLRIVVNRAADKIRLTRETQKLELEKARTLFDLDTEKSRLRTIIESLPDGVLVTNTGGQVVLINPSCRQMLKLGRDAASGRPIQDYLPDEALCRLVMDISKGKYVDYEDIPEQEVRPGRRDLFAGHRPTGIGGTKGMPGGDCHLPRHYQPEGAGPAQVGIRGQGVP